MKDIYMRQRQAWTRRGTLTSRTDSKDAHADTHVTESPRQLFRSGCESGARHSAGCGPLFTPRSVCVKSRETQKHMPDAFSGSPRKHFFFVLFLFMQTWRRTLANLADGWKSKAKKKNGSFAAYRESVSSGCFCFVAKTF